MSVAGPAIHLVRHGEVANPAGVVYGDLPGFSLDRAGRRQAAAAAHHLAGSAISAVVSSPLDRAQETAALVARPHGVPVATDRRLIEWTVGAGWVGRAWADLPDLFPGELAGYLDHPDDLPFASEPLTAVAHRVAAAAMDAWDGRPDAAGGVVVVGHQDPIEAGRRLLTGRGLAGFHEAKPEHGAVVTLRPGRFGWHEDGVWVPVPAES